MRKADNLPLSCAVVTKSGNLNFLRTLLGDSRPVMELLYLILIDILYYRGRDNVSSLSLLSL